MRLFEKFTTSQDQGSGSSMNDASTENPEGVHSSEKLPAPVYYVESPDDDTVLVGINVTINHDKVGDNEITIVNWYDTAHERTMIASETEQDGEYFAFKRAEQDGGGIYYFAPMNINLYNDSVKQRLADGSDFSNDEDLISAFLQTLDDNF